MVQPYNPNKPYELEELPSDSLATSLLSLPTELIYHVFFDFSLNWCDRIACKFVSRRIRAIVLSAKLKCTHRPYTFCAEVAKLGNKYFGLLQWARSNNVQWNENVCAYAAIVGHLDVLKWAKANGAPWDEGVFIYAAHGGHLDVLKWAKANGALWDDKFFDILKKQCNIEIVQWLKDLRP